MGDEPASDPEEEQSSEEKRGLGDKMRGKVKDSLVSLATSSYDARADDIACVGGEESFEVAPIYANARLYDFAINRHFLAVRVVSAVLVCATGFLANVSLWFEELGTRSKCYQQCHNALHREYSPTL